MNLEWSEEQLALRDMIRGVCETYAPLETVRALENDPRGFPDELWKQLGELGVTGLLVPEAFGGAGQGLLEAVVVFEELGRALAPTPLFASGLLAAGVLEAAGSEAQQREWLPRLATGEAIVVPAWLEPERGFGAEGVQLRAEAGAEGFVLSGTKRHVPFAAAATRLLVLARTGDADGDVDLFLVDSESPGVTLTQQKSLASETLYELRFDSVALPESARVGAAGGGWATWESAMLDGVVALAAQAMGGAEKALEVTVQYAKDRKQFDKPLGAFQAISHYLADAKTRLDGGRTLVYQAAWARAAGEDTTRLAPMAKLFACQTYRDLTATCQQIWGGVGFTIEYDIQLYFRRAKQLQISWWDSHALEERIAASVLD